MNAPAIARPLLPLSRGELQDIALSLPYIRGVLRQNVDALSAKCEESVAHAMPLGE